MDPIYSNCFWLADHLAHVPEPSLEGEISADVAIIGAGGIGFDVAAFLSQPVHQDVATSAGPIEAYLKEWGIDRTLAARGGVEGVRAQPPACKASI